MIKHLKLRSTGAWLPALALSGLAFSGCSAMAEPAREMPAPSPASSAPSADAGNGRFAMTPVADGFLRLDTRTGQTSLCRIEGGQAQCRASADERAALEAEIDRLARENAALKARAPASQGDEEDRRFDRALDRAERFMRRMLQLFRDADGRPPHDAL